MPTKSKTKRTAKVYDNKLHREFERGDWADDPDGPFFREYYLRRRHLAYGRTETGHRGLKCEIESDRLSEAIDDGLALIKHRDGADVLKQVSGDLLLELLTSIEYLRGGLPPSWRGVLREIVAERQAADAKIDAQLERRVRRGEITKAIAA
jgi:hypothetical protein